MNLFEGIITAMVPISGALSVVIDRWLKSRGDKFVGAAKVESLNVSTTTELVEAVRKELGYYTEQLAAARLEIAHLSNQVAALSNQVLQMGGNPEIPTYGRAV